MKAINLEKLESNLSLGTYTGLAQLDCLLIGPKVHAGYKSQDTISLRISLLF